MTASRSLPTREELPQNPVSGADATTHLAGLLISFITGQKLPN